MKNRLLIVCCFSLLFTAPALHATPPVYTLQAGIGSDDVSGKNDTFYRVAAGVLFSQGLSRNSIVDFTAEVSSYTYQEVDDNSAQKLFLQGEYSYTPRAGFSVPTYSVALRQLEESKKDSDFDASTTSLLLSVGYRIDDQTNVLGGLRFSEKSSNLDSSETGIFGNIDYLLSDQWLLYATVIISDEDIEGESGSGTAGRPPAGRYGAMGHSGGSASFSGSPTADISSDNTLITVGAGYMIDGQNSIDAAISNRTYDTDDDKLSGNVITLDYFYRF